MARDRNLPLDFWTWENVVACKPGSRLLFLGLWNFADNHGVMPLRPQTIRLQVFPADEIDDARVSAMIEELAAHRLVRVYEVEGNAYLQIADWAIHQRLSKRARRSYPADPSMPVREPPPPPAPPPVPADALEHAPPQSPPEPPPDPPRLAPIAKPERWRRMIKNLLRQYWARHPAIELMDDEVADRWTAKWIAQGCDFNRDILPVVRDFCAMKPFCGPPCGFQELDEHVARNRARHEEASSGSCATTGSQSFDHARRHTAVPAPCEMTYAAVQGS
ncbi:MAG: hypothetical protein AB7O88_26615 [Reyranellaceae bacterium]